MLRIAVTGATSDFGAVIIPRLLDDDRVERVVGVSRGACGIRHDKYRHVQMDIRDRAIQDIFDGCDTVVHLAFVVEEIRDKKLIHDINIGGSINVLECASKAAASHLVIASSINAYGNPTGRDPLDETTFPMGDPNCYYHYGKAQVEHYAEWWARRNADGMTVTILRPSYIVGQHFANDGIAAMTARLFAIPQARSASFQYLHEDDLATAFCLVIHHRLEGVFNLAPTDSTPVRRLARMHGQTLVNVPMKIARPGADLLYALRLAKFSGQWATPGEPPVDSSLFQRRAAWTPTLTSDEAAALMLLYRGRPIVERAYVPRRQVACETVLRPTTEYVAERLATRCGVHSAPTHHQVALPGGVTAHVERHAARTSPARTVLMLPAPAWHARFYTHLVSALADDLEVLIIDPPGSGLSGGKRMVVGAAVVALAVEHVWRALGSGRGSDGTPGVVVFASPPAGLPHPHARPDLLLVSGPVAIEERVAELRRCGFATLRVDESPLDTTAAPEIAARIDEWASRSID